MSTAMWRLRPTIFLPASYPLVFASGALTDWLSMTPPVGLASRPDALSVEHQRDIVDRLKHEPTDKSAKPPIDGLPGREIIRQHPPSPARTRHVADRVQHLPQIDLDRSPCLRRARKKRLNPRPLLVGQVARIPLGLLLDLGHSAARRWGPHPKLESRPKNPFNQFSNGLLNSCGAQTAPVRIFSIKAMLLRCRLFRRPQTLDFVFSLG